MPGRTSARPLAQGDKKTCQVPPGHSACCEFGCWGVPAWERGSPQRCPAPVPVTALRRVLCPPVRWGKALSAAREKASRARAERSVHHLATLLAVPGPFLS